MRCGRAQEWMAAALDGELSPRRRRALDRHLTTCDVCRADFADTDRVLRSVAALPMEATVPTALEQATMRRVRVAAAEEIERPTRWGWWPLPVAVAAMASVALIAVGLVGRSGNVDTMPTATAPRVAGPVATAVPPAPPKRVARAEGRTPAPVPNEPPPQLANAPDLFMELPILRNMEKLEHFEAIRTTTLDDEPATPGGEEPPSNG